MVFNKKEIDLVMRDMISRGIKLKSLNQAHVTAIALRLACKNLNLGNRVGAVKSTELQKLILHFNPVML